MADLGVNIDHVATLRQARRTVEPDPVQAAFAAELGGADQLTVHLREDRRHIQDRDLRLLRETARLPLNLELAAAPEIIKIACAIKDVAVEKAKAAAGEVLGVNEERAASCDCIENETASSAGASNRPLDEQEKEGAADCCCRTGNK